MGSQTEDAQAGFGDVTKATPGSWIHPGEVTSRLGRAGSSWLYGLRHLGAGPHGQILHHNRAKRPWERSHAGGGQLDRASPRGPPR